MRQKALWQLLQVGFKGCDVRNKEVQVSILLSGRFDSL
jgi:hypothetical protein